MLGVAYHPEIVAVFIDVCEGLLSTSTQDSDAIKLFVGQIPKHMEEEDLRPVFEEFGEIFDLAVIRDKISGLHRGKGAVGV